LVELLLEFYKKVLPKKYDLIKEEILWRNLVIWFI
jgi:hypothetical protein